MKGFLGRLFCRHDWIATGEWDHDLEWTILRCAKCGKEEWGDALRGRFPKGDSGIYGEGEG